MAPPKGKTLKISTGVILPTNWSSILKEPPFTMAPSTFSLYAKYIAFVIVVPKLDCSPLTEKSRPSKGISVV